MCTVHPYGVTVQSSPNLNMANRPVIFKDTGSAMDPDELLEYARKGSIVEEFTEAQEVKQLAERLPQIYNEQISVELALERFTSIVDKYQEQPHLMDPYLEEMTLRFLDITRRSDIEPKLYHLAFKFLYLITKARGLKTVVRVLPHEVADLEPVLHLLYQQDASDAETWETRYILFLWLSIICMIPFDMARLDSNARTATGEVREPTMLRILNIGKRYLTVSDKSRDAAAWMVAKFLTRQDVKNEQLPDFMDWSLKTMMSVEYDTMRGITTLSGILMAMAQLFKHGKREDLRDYAPIMLEKLIEFKMFDVKNTQIRKFAIKLTQRLGLTFLKARVATWRYQRGSRSLAENLKPTGSVPAGVNIPAAVIDEDEEYDVPEEVEDVIEQLLIGLKDKDTVVRWSAAKGIGRVTNRLPQELADEVVESVLELFSTVERDEAWHGGCLALAELGRRGLLLPERLPQVVPVVIKALMYDERRGACSVGSHVRDAACYVCWSFARAYDPQVIKTHVNQIATALVIATVFDREVSCRKAASAAFQENVGRQGSFPHGIDIVTTADYFAVGSRTKTYLDISVYIAQFEEYTRPLIDHLSVVKIAHWDMFVRELAAQALHKLTVKDPEYMKAVLRKIIPLCSGIDLNTRHGATCATGEIVHALSLYAEEKNSCIGDYLDDATIKALKEITVNMEAGEMFKGLTGEILRPAACELIEKLSLSKLPCPEKEVIDHWQSVMDDNLIHLLRTEIDIHSKAVTAFSAFCHQYYQQDNGQAIPEKQDDVLSRYTAAFKHSQELPRMGATKAVGNLPKFFISGKLDQIIDSLIAASLKTPASEKFAEARRDTFTAMASICKTAGLSNEDSRYESISKEQINSVLAALFEGMRDYTTDSRGDVGAWVREACMVAVSEIIQLVLTQQPTYFDQGVYERLMQILAQQAAEKIDRTRTCAGGIFLNLLYQEDPTVPHIPHRKQLMEIFPKQDTQFLNWSAARECFPKIVQLLSLPPYRYHVLLGLTVSVGGITESLVKHSGQSLMAYLRTHNTKDELQTLAEIMLNIFKDYQKIDRVSLPMMKMCDLLLSSGSFDNLLEDRESSFPPELLDLMKMEISKSGDAQKLLSSIDLFCALLQFEGNIRKRCLTQLCIFICHKYPKVRKTAANKLYEALLVYDDIIPEDHVDSVQEVLTETDWQDKIEVVRPVRNQLCEYLGIPKPVMKTKSGTDQGKNAD